MKGTLDNDYAMDIDELNTQKLQTIGYVQVSSINLF